MVKKTLIILTALAVLVFAVFKLNHVGEKVRKGGHDFYIEWDWGGFCTKSVHYSGKCTECMYLKQHNRWETPTKKDSLMHRLTY